MIVFISHSWHDKSLATFINETLQKDGHRVWYDIHQLVPGDNIQAVIDAYLEQCDVVVVLWTAQALASGGVQAELQTAKSLGKRIIPLQADGTPLDAGGLKGLLGIPFEDVPTGMLLLQRGLLMLMASEQYKEAPWFKEAFDNVVDLSGYINYTNTYRVKQDNNNDGYKEQWVNRLEALRKKNEYIRQQLMPKAAEKMEMLQYMMKHLEQGNVPLETLQQWHLWCTEHAAFHPELMQKLKEFLEHDMQRLHKGGAPVSVLNTAGTEQTIARLQTAIAQKKEAAYTDLFQKIKKYGGLFLNDKMIEGIANGYLAYVTTCPQLLKALMTEALASQFVAVKEAVVQLANYLEKQDHNAEMQKNNLEGYFDDAYLINNTAKLLIEAKLVPKEKLPIDFISVHLIDKYVSFILDKQTKAQLDAILQQIRNIIGLKKDEINWGQVAAVVIGASVLGGLISNANTNVGNNRSSGSRFFEDEVANFSARYGGGLNPYS